MMLYLYSDVALKDLGLVELKDDPIALKNESLRIAAHGSDIGKALSCYSMSLTERCQRKKRTCRYYPAATRLANDWRRRGSPGRSLACFSTSLAVM